MMCLRRLLSYTGHRLSTEKYRVELLSRAHDRASFSCGEDALDRYLKEAAGQDMRRGLAAVHVLIDVTAPNTIAGFYSLSASGIPLDDFPEDIVARLPKYPSVPVSLVGRLATDLRFQGQRCGLRLVVDALMRSCTISEQLMGIHGVVVEAKSEGVVPFYKRFGFAQFKDSPLRLYIPIKTAREAVRPLLPGSPTGTD